MVVDVEDRARQVARDIGVGLDPLTEGQLAEHLDFDVALALFGLLVEVGILVVLQVHTWGAGCPARVRIMEVHFQVHTRGGEIPLAVGHAVAVDPAVQVHPTDDRGVRGLARAGEKVAMLT